MERPHLIEDLKYDFRLYVLIYGVSPMRVYLHRMAFARFCSEPYRKPNHRNMKNTFMHLTNYAINKYAGVDDEDVSPGAGYEWEGGYKRSLGAILRIL